jgi:antagonist of KipI
MSLEIIKKGMLDTLQDGGRFGYQHLGITTNGPMDQFSSQLANALVGNELSEGVMEICFPAAHVRFLSAAIVAITGADFEATIHGQRIPLNTPIAVSSGTELRFKNNRGGRFGYLAVRNGFQIEKWLGSASTNLKAKVGGLGRALVKGDRLDFKQEFVVDETSIFPWSFPLQKNDSVIRCIEGNEFDWLTKLSQQQFYKQSFAISSTSDRMAYRLEGAALKQATKKELLSTVAHFGTIQLLPNGQLVCLMADHQTTGGYPRIAQVIAADLPTLAQQRPNDAISFQPVSLEDAEDLLLEQHTLLKQIQYSCRFKFRET